MNPTNLACIDELVREFLLIEVRLPYSFAFFPANKAVQGDLDSTNMAALTWCISP